MFVRGISAGLNWLGIVLVLDVLSPVFSFEVSRVVVKV